MAGRIYPNLKSFPRRRSAPSFGHGRSARAKMATDQWPQNSSSDRKTDPPIPDLPSRKLGDLYYICLILYIYIYIYIIYFKYVSK